MTILYKIEKQWEKIPANVKTYIYFEFLNNTKILINILIYTKYDLY